MWGRRRVSYSLERSDRPRLKITVTPNCEVRVVAPAEVDDEEVRERVRRRGHWIVRQIEDFEQYRPRTPPRQFISGETHLLKGTQYRLKVFERPAPNVFVRHDRIVLETPHPDSRPHKAGLLKYLYRLEAHRELPSRLDAAVPAFATDGIKRPRLIIRSMVKRWGSFTPSGNLVLNLDLIRAPVHCIDYVIVHELAHALQPDHSPRWRQVMDRVMPDWRERKKQLEQSLL
jgi:predicted metal-dependent hydrolase